MEMLTTAFLMSQKLAGLKLQTKIRRLPFAIPVWHRHAGITGNSPPGLWEGFVALR